MSDIHKTPDGLLGQINGVQLDSKGHNLKLYTIRRPCRLCSVRLWKALKVKKQKPKLSLELDSKPESACIGGRNVKMPRMIET